MNPTARTRSSFADTPLADPRTFTERSEEDLSWVGLAVAETIRVAELAAIVLAALLVCPPLMILLVVVVVPALALTALVALVASVLALPVFVIRHLHQHRAPHAHRRVLRLAELGRAESASGTSRVRRLVALAQLKLYAKSAEPATRERSLGPPK